MFPKAGKGADVFDKIFCKDPSASHQRLRLEKQGKDASQLLQDYLIG